jgi:hypothetical protein
MTEHVRDDYEFPTDLPDDADPAGALRWTAAVTAMTGALLALTNAAAISGWASSFDPKPAIVMLVHAADGWEEATARLDLGSPHARMHKAWKRMEQARWSGNGPVVEQAAIDENVARSDPSINE